MPVSSYFENKAATLVLLLENSGTTLLSQNLTVNNTTVSPDFLYEAKNIDGATWVATVGDNLSKISGTPNEISTPFLDGTVANRFDATTYYRNSSPTTSNGANDDCVWEFIFRNSSESGTRFVGYRDDASAQGGWFLAADATLDFRIKDASTAAQLDMSTTTTGWNHLLVFLDRSESTANESFHSYVNGVSNTSINASAVGDMTDAQAVLAIGATGTGAAPLTSNESVVWVAQWSQSGWFAGGGSNASEWASFAKERFHTLVGTFPLIARGSVEPTFIRATKAALDIQDPSTGITKLHRVGAGWPRVCRRKDLAGNYISGYLSEVATTNLNIRSEEFNTSWTKAVSGDTFVDGYSSPGEFDTADGFVADNTSGTHWIYHVETVTNATEYIQSVYAKAGNWRYLLLSGSVPSGAGVWFDLIDGYVSSSAGGENSSGIENMGDGWYRCWRNITTNSTSGQIRYGFSNVDGVSTQTGNNTIVGYLYGTQFEEASDDGGVTGPTSYINTVGSTATRNVDNLSYANSSGDNYPDGASDFITIIADVLLPNDDRASASSTIISAEEDTNNYHQFRQRSVGDETQMFTRRAAATQLNPITSPANNLSDGYIHQIATTIDYGGQEAEVFTDWVSGATDTGSNASISSTAIYIGHRTDIVDHEPNGLIRKVRIYDSVYTETA